MQSSFWCAVLRANGDVGTWNCNLGEKLVPFLQVQGYTPPEFQIWSLCSLGKSGCSAELVGVTAVSQTPWYCHEIWIRHLFSVLKPTCFKGHDTMQRRFGYFFLFSAFVCLLFLPHLRPIERNNIRLCTHTFLFSPETIVTSSAPMQPLCTWPGCFFQRNSTFEMFPEISVSI